MLLMRQLSFISNVSKDNTDKLQISRTTLLLLSDRFRICSKFAGMIQMQMCPSRELEYDTKTNKISRIQYLYSAIDREFTSTPTASVTVERFLECQRSIAWTSRDMHTGSTTMVVLRCPAQTQKQLVDAFSEVEHRRHLLRYPMIIHACFAEDIFVRSMEFSREIAAPMYGWVSILGKLLHNASK